MRALLFAVVVGCMFTLCPITSAQHPTQLTPRERFDSRWDEFDHRQDYRRDWYRSPTFDRQVEFEHRRDFRHNQYKRFYPPYGPQRRSALVYDTHTSLLYFSFWY